MDASVFSWTKPTTQLAEAFRNASPYGHVVVDGVLDEAFVDALIAEFPPLIEMAVHFDGPNDRKSQMSDVARMQPSLRRLHESVSSPEFMGQLGEITGIPNLMPDPDYAGGGLHQGGDGSFLDVHADFNFHEGKQLYRRLNLIVYLNRGWLPDWGGALELWDREMKRAEVSVVPVANRCVLFETTDTSFHGYRKVTLPKGSPHTRKSFAAYYYTRERPEGDVFISKYTRFMARPDDDLGKKVGTSVRTGIKDILAKTKRK